MAVAAEMGRLQEHERQLEAELHDAREVEPPSELDDETVANLLGEETLRVLQTARESASQIKIRAEDTAARILREANDEANRLRQDADVEAARRRQDAASDAEAEVALAKQQGREMVNEARAYRERVLADLERRTTLARQQIEELIHGRDRLLQVFERARLVAVDVTSELKAIDSPDELVNLTPTTGPVPIMVPTERRPARPVDDAATDDSTDQEPTDDTASTDDADDAAGGDDASVADVAVDDIDVATDVDEADVADDTASTVDDTDDENDETSDVADSDQHGDADSASADDDSSAGEATESTADTNVVSLFRGRPAAADAAVADDHPSTDSVAGGDDVESDDSDDRPDVGGIFERLRQSVPDGDTTTVTAPPSAPAETDVDGATADDGDTAGADDDAADTADDDADEVVVESNAFTRRDESLVPLIVAGARRVKRILADEQNEALDTLRQGEPVTELDDLVPVADEHVATYLAALDEEIQAAAAAGAGELGSNDTKTLRKKLTKAGALKAAESHVRSALVGPLRDRLERAIADGDGDNDEITKRVRAVYREWKTQHIDDQLDDVFRSAYSGGLHAGAASDAQLVWTSDPRVAPCPDCEDNALAGPVKPGTEYPTGHPSAPAHPGCTCLTLPVD